MDEEDLVDNEKALSQEQRDKLQSKIEAFLSKPTPTNPGPTKNEAFRWQAHLLTYILNGNVIPVVRNEILCALKLGKNFVLDETLGVWVIDVSVPACRCCCTLCTSQTGKPDGGFQETKTKTPIYIKFPRSETRLVCRWVDEFRPALLASAKRVGIAHCVAKIECSRITRTCLSRSKANRAPTFPLASRRCSAN